MYLIKFGLFYSLFFLLNLFAQVQCLKKVQIKVPATVAVGDDVTLTCEYDMEYDILYQIHWYYGQREFYRYTPEDTPTSKFFPISGFSVDMRKSTKNKVTLKSVTRKNSGKYSCEVLADAPSFHTDRASSSMLVAQLPESEPIIKIDIPNIANNYILTFGETFIATCVSGYSYPAVNFTWIINGLQYPRSNKAGFRPIDYPDVHKESESEIIITVDNKIMESYQKHINVRCETSIYNLYHSSANIDLKIIRDNDIDNSTIDPLEIQLYFNLIKFIYYVHKFVIGAVVITIIVVMIYKEYNKRV